MTKSEIHVNEKLSANIGGELFLSGTMQDTDDTEDYYTDPKTGLLVFTATYHKKRGYCCGSGCRHCPFSKNEK